MKLSRMSHCASAGHACSRSTATHSAEVHPADLGVVVVEAAVSDLDSGGGVGGRGARVRVRRAASAFVVSAGIRAVGRKGRSQRDKG